MVGAAKGDKAGEGTANGGATPPNPEIARKIAALRTQLRESFGKIVMAMMMVPRYRHQSLADLSHLVLDPMLRDRIAIAAPGGKAGEAENPLAEIVAFAIWASVSEEVEGRIREQIKAGTWPLRLKPEDWTSGERHWLIDVVAPDRRMAAALVAGFGALVKGSELNLHPLIARLVDKDVLDRLGARRRGADTGAGA